jgi:hypothetical protein
MENKKDNLKLFVQTISMSYLVNILDALIPLTASVKTDA